jgi:hypothetical protein
MQWMGSSFTPPVNRMPPDRACPTRALGERDGGSRRARNSVDFKVTYSVTPQAVWTSPYQPPGTRVQGCRPVRLADGELRTLCYQCVAALPRARAVMSPSSSTPTVPGVP